VFRVGGGKGRGKKKTKGGVVKYERFWGKRKKEHRQNLKGGNEHVIP